MSQLSYCYTMSEHEKIAELYWPFTHFKCAEEVLFEKLIQRVSLKYLSHLFSLPPSQNKSAVCHDTDASQFL